MTVNTDARGRQPVDDGEQEDVNKLLLEWRQSINGFRLSLDESALVLVDLQYGSAADGGGYSKAFRELGYGKTMDAYYARIDDVVIPNVQRLQATFRRAKAPVVFLTVGSIAGGLSDMAPHFSRSAAFWRSKGVEPPEPEYGSRDMTVREEIAPLPGEPIVPKPSASGFTASALERVLWNLKARTLVFAGVSTSYCVESTLRDAADRGFNCFLVEDACADTTPELHDRGIRSAFPFCRVGVTDDVIREVG